MPAAHAGRPEVSIYPSLAQIKAPAGEYDGPIDAQVMLGDIYSKNLARKVDGLKSYEHPKRMGNHFKAELFESAQRNRIEAYFWYSLAAAHLTFHELVTDIDPNSQPLTGTDKAYADYAWDRMQSLKKSSWRNKIVGPSFWTAEKLFVDGYTYRNIEEFLDSVLIVDEGRAGILSEVEPIQRDRFDRLGESVEGGRRYDQVHRLNLLRKL